jgi:hypothetical protein
VLGHLLDLAAEDVAHVVAEAILEIALAAEAELRHEIAIRQQFAGHRRQLGDHRSVALDGHEVGQADDPDVRLEVSVLDMLIEVDVE